MKTYLGIDTSCYTTSLAVVDGEGNLLSEARKILSVPQGGRGLSQHEAVFQHIGNLPQLLQAVVNGNNPASIQGVAASTRPRPIEGSYMPVFRVAETYGKSMASVLGVPFVSTSHQEGHLAAGIWSAGGPQEKEFLAVHLSGGTTELLLVVRREARNNRQGTGFDITILGGARDLHAGQFIDRVGVSLGLPFPAGPRLEALAALGGNTGITIPSSVKNYDISFSGPEAAAARLVAQKADPAGIARAVEKCIAGSLEKVLSKAVPDTGIWDVLIVGGVSANSYIRERLSERLHHKVVGARLHFAGPGLSSDNAVGIALIGMEGLNSLWFE